MARGARITDCRKSFIGSLYSSYNARPRCSKANPDERERRLSTEVLYMSLSFGWDGWPAFEFDVAPY